MRRIAWCPWLTLLAVAAFSACSRGRVCSSDSDCPSGATCDVDLRVCFQPPASRDAGAVAPDLLVEIASPSGSMITNGDVSIQLKVSGAAPDKVELLIDGDVLTEIAPPFLFEWRATTAPEGEYALRARATSGGRTFESADRIIRVDRTAPSFVSVSPYQGASDVSVHLPNPISAKFSEPLRRETVSAANIIVTASGGNPVEKTTTLSEDGELVTITPTTTPVAPTTWSISFEGVTDLAGNAVHISSDDWTFTFPAGIPVGSPRSAVAGNTRTEQPQMEIDFMNRPVVAWIENDGAEKNVHVQRWSGAEWESLGDMLSATSGTGTSTVSLSMALDPAGNPVVAPKPSRAEPEPALFRSRWLWTQPEIQSWHGARRTAPTLEFTFGDGMALPGVLLVRTSPFSKGLLRRRSHSRLSPQGTL